ncbi:MAG: metal ABC transporter solute-binding protein, Zn/Mn family [Sarcina sp.]
MKKKSILGAVVITLILAIIGCVPRVKETTTDNVDKIKVMTSIYPIKEFVQIIGGDKVSVKSMVPDSAEPHDFEPKAKDLLELKKSDLFVYNGLGMEHWVDKVLETAKNDNVMVVNSSENADVILVDHSEDEHNHDGHDHEEGEVHEDEHNHGPQDPHIWLSFSEVKKQSKLIEEALIKIDPSNKAYYENNYNNFANQLTSLSTQYNEKFASLDNKDFVTGHAAFAYLCRDFKLNQISVENALGEGEITPKQLKEIADYAKANNIKVIFMPDTASEKISKTLATEVGAKVVKISSLETKNGDKGYIETMKENLDTIYNSLKNE